jgi:hypothetical protein
MSLERVLPSGKQSELDIGWLGGCLRDYKLKMQNLFQTMLIGLAVLTSQADVVVVNEITPSKAESAWLEIDWETDLWEARKEAARTDKPIYLWEMDGHPLGCV